MSGEGLALPKGRRDDVTVRLSPTMSKSRLIFVNAYLYKNNDTAKAPRKVNFGGQTFILKLMLWGPDDVRINVAGPIEGCHVIPLIAGAINIGGVPAVAGDGDPGRFPIEHANCAA